MKGDTWMAWKKAAALVAIMFGFSTPGLASDFYVGAGVGLSSVNGETEDDINISRGFPSEISLRGLTFNDRDSTWRLFAGYQFHPRFAAEVGYSDLGQFDYDGSINVSGTLGIESWTFAGRWNVPVTDIVFLTGRAGFARANFDAKGEIGLIIIGGPIVIPPASTVPWKSPDNRWGVLFDFGVAWRMLPKWDLTLSYEQQRVKVQDVEALTLSVTFKP